jgi:serine/threonine-protein kinase
VGRATEPAVGVRDPLLELGIDVDFLVHFVPMIYVSAMSVDGEAEDPRAEERVGSVLADKWTLERLLGLGGMGAVYAARHRNGARAAIKLLHNELARNSEVRERFRRESYAANKVEHRSTVKVLDDDVIKDGPDEGSAYIVMELLEGEPLDARAEREPRLNEREVLEILDTVLDVLETAHAKGVVHRDLKPENLFLAKDPDTGGTRLKVLDFGLAKIAEAARVTGHGLALGTPAFMSPEQAAGLPDIDGRADLFALGATAFFCFTGRHVHEAETILQQIIKMAKDPAPPLKSIAPMASDDFAAIIDRSLQVEREMRYPDAGAMRADVKAALDLRGATDNHRTLITAISVPPGARSTNPPPASEPISKRPTTGEKEKKGGRFPLLLLLLIALGGVAWFKWPLIKAKLERSGPEPTTPVPTTPPSAAVADAGAELDATIADAASDAETDASALGVLDEAGAGDAGLDEEEDDEEEDAGPTHADAAAPHPSGRPITKPRLPGTKKPTKVRKKKH